MLAESTAEVTTACIRLQGVDASLAARCASLDAEIPARRSRLDDLSTLLWEAKLMAMFGVEVLEQFMREGKSSDDAARVCCTLEEDLTELRTQRDEEWCQLESQLVFRESLQLARAACASMEVCLRRSLRGLVDAAALTTETQSFVHVEPELALTLRLISDRRNVLRRRSRARQRCSLSDLLQLRFEPLLAGSGRAAAAEGDRQARLFGARFEVLTGLSMLQDPAAALQRPERRRLAGAAAPPSGEGQVKRLDYLSVKATLCEEFGASVWAEQKPLVSLALELAATAAVPRDCEAGGAIGRGGG